MRRWLTSRYAIGCAAAVSAAGLTLGAQSALRGPAPNLPIQINFFQDVVKTKAGKMRQIHVGLANSLGHPVTVAIFADGQGSQWFGLDPSNTSFDKSFATGYYNPEIASYPPQSGFEVTLAGSPHPNTPAQIEMAQSSVTITIPARDTGWVEVQEEPAVNAPNDMPPGSSFGFG